MEPFSDIRSIASMSRQEFETTCMAFTNNTPLGNTIALCKVLTKYNIYVDTNDTGIAPHLATDGYWESWITQCLAEKVQPGFICLDIGANFGYYSLLMAELTGSSGRTIAIEPNPALVELLQRTNADNACKFEISAMAMADKPGEAILSVPRQSWGSASLLAAHAEAVAGTFGVKVNVSTVDEMVAALGLPRVDMIKMDVEGLEPKVFAGMQQTITANPSLQMIIEYSPFLYEEPKTFSDYLFSCFSIYRIKDVDRIEKQDAAAMDKLLSLTDHTDLYLARK